MSRFMAALGKIRRDPLFANSRYCVSALPGEILLAVHRGPGRRICGVFSLKGISAPVSVDAPEGVYKNLIDGTAFRIEDGKLSCRGTPVVFELLDK